MNRDKIVLEAIESALRIMVPVQMGEQQQVPELKQAIDACRHARTILLDKENGI